MVQIEVEWFALFILLVLWRHYWGYWESRWGHPWCAYQRSERAFKSLYYCILDVQWRASISILKSTITSVVFLLTLTDFFPSPVWEPLSPWVAQWERSSPYHKFKSCWCHSHHDCALEEKTPASGVAQISVVLVLVPSPDKVRRVASGRASGIKPVLIEHEDNEPLWRSLMGKAKRKDGPVWKPPPLVPV